jgi:molecular chaperone GrpE
MNDQQALDKSESRANVDYVRKLHQQIVQKDNIIKLLQLQVKNLESTGADAENVERLSVALADAEDRLLEFEQRQNLQEAEGGSSRVRELEERVRDLESEARKVRKLEAALELGEQELQRHKELLRSADDESGALKQLRKEVQERDERLKRLERDLGEARERAAGAGRGDDDERVRVLEEQIADLEAALELARQRIEELERPKGGEKVSRGDDFRLCQDIIEALQVLDDLRSEVFDETEALEALELHLGALRDSLGLQRILTEGEPFDPHQHSLGRVVYSEEGEHDTVVAEEVAGYRVGERVIKLAQVSVVRNPYQCPKCEAIGVRGASFCHVCGGRISARKGDGTGEMPRGRPRDEARRLLDFARSARRQGDEVAAREKVERALEVAPGDSQVLFEAALLEEEQGNFDLALEYLVDVPERVPGLKGLEALRQRLHDKQDILDRLKRMR